MNKLFLGFAIIFFINYSCSTNSNKALVSLKRNDSISLLDTLSIKRIKIFQFPNDSKIDSVLINLPDFSSFAKTVENLSSLNPKGLEVFLMDAIIKCDKLLLSKFPKEIDVPPVKSRLKVVKTKILICKYYSSINDILMLEKSMKEMFISYNFFLEIISDTIINEGITIESF
tara:strand:- start:940 stop:1455 length:516 start_codon:yes stop_codon:yes gene_type:complete